MEAERQKVVDNKKGLDGEAFALAGRILGGREAELFKKGVPRRRHRENMALLSFAVEARYYLDGFGQAPKVPKCLKRILDKQKKENARQQRAWLRRNADPKDANFAVTATLKLTSREHERFHDDLHKSGLCLAVYLRKCWKKARTQIKDNYNAGKKQETAKVHGRRTGP